MLPWGTTEFTSGGLFVSHTQMEGAGRMLAGKCLEIRLIPKKQKFIILLISLLPFPLQASLMIPR